MFSIVELKSYLDMHESDYEIMAHDTPILSTQDASKYFDIEKAAPTLIMDTEQGLVAFIVSSKRGKLNYNAMKQELGFIKLKLADNEKVEKITGYKVGALPLIGHNLPCVFDDYLFDHDYVYGGSGDALKTLKIRPDDVLRLNNVIKHIQKA